MPAPREDAGSIARQDLLLRRVRESKEPVNLVFVGDSITQAWEGPGADAWKRAIAPLGALNLGNSGDRTEHVLWRLREAPLTALRPKAIVLLIGTNNLGHGKSNAAETLQGVRRVVDVLHEQCPQAQVLLMAVFPRGEQMNAMRGDLLQVNQAMAGAHLPRTTIIDIGDTFVNADGSIKKELMPDALHLSPAGYDLWAQAVVAAAKPMVAKP